VALNVRTRVVPAPLLISLPNSTLATARVGSRKPRATASSMKRRAPKLSVRAVWRAT